MKKKTIWRKSNKKCQKSLSLRLLGERDREKIQKSKLYTNLKKNLICARQRERKKDRDNK